MMSKRAHQLYAAQESAKPRREGHALSLLKLPTSTGEEGSVDLGLDMSTAPVPQRRYAAEFCQVSIVRGDFRFVFTQERLDGSGVDSALVIRFNEGAARQLLESIEQMPHGIEVIARNMKIEVAEEYSITQQPSQLAHMVANIASIAVSGYETCMDFYHASAFSFRRVNESSTLDVEPVVRVDIHTSVFLSIVRKFKQLVESLPPPPTETQS